MTPPAPPRPTSADRLRRLLAMLPWLASAGGASVRDLAERFGLPDDEVVAELEMAACCGLPPYSPDQLIELIIDGDRVEANFGGLLARPQRFTPAEGFTLAASARALLAVPGADPTGALARAVAKLDAVLGHRAVAVDLDEPPLLSEVRAAIERRESAEIEYYAATRDELTTRRVDPYVVYGRDGRWYLDAWCHVAGDVRHFRVDRIRAWRRAGALFDPPPALAPGEVFAPGPEAQGVTLVVPPEGYWVLETYPTSSAEALAGGRLRVRLAVGGTAWLERLLLRLGPEATVEEPPEWVALGAQVATRLLARYR